MLISIHLEKMIKQTTILTQAKLFLSPQEEQEEDLLGNQKANKKHCLEDEKLKKEGSPILTSPVCTRSYLSIMAIPRMQPITIT